MFIDGFNPGDIQDLQTMREQYCIHTIEKIRSKPVIRTTEQQEMFRVECISKVMSNFMII